MTDLYDHLQTLETSRLIQLAGFEPELEYLFRHGLVQNAAYESMLRRQRQTLHRAIGETLERLHADRLDEQAGILAYHFSRAVMPEKSLHYLMRAARRAAAIYANAEAIAYYRAAQQEVGVLLAQSKGWAQDAAQIEEGLGDVLFHIGQRSEARAALEQALAYVPAFERVWQARLHRRIGQTLLEREAKLSKYAVAAKILGEASATSNALWWHEWIELQKRIVYFHYFGDEVAEMDATLRQMEPQVKQHGSLRQQADFSGAMVSMLYRRERYQMNDTILRYAHDALDLSEQMHDLDHIATAQAELGCCYLWYGDLDRAEAYMMQSLGYAEQTDNIWKECQNVTHLTTVYRMRGNVERVRSFAQRAMDRATRVQLYHYIGAAHANLCWVAWRDGDREQAAHHGAAAVDHWNKAQGYPWGWLMHFPLLAMALTRAEAETARQHARALLDPSQQRLSEALAGALREGIEADEAAMAQTHLERAIKIAAEMGYL